ncbi:hypothetical protein A6P55_23310 [Pandoraea pnomenusa]|nr:hypothetical protein A6P55_23310 [Pandoraea pnomenusa]
MIGHVQLRPIDRVDAVLRQAASRDVLDLARRGDTADAQHIAGRRVAARKRMDHPVDDEPLNRHRSGRGRSVAQDDRAGKSRVAYRDAVTQCEDVRRYQDIPTPDRDCAIAADDVRSPQAHRLRTAYDTAIAQADRLRTGRLSLPSDGEGARRTRQGVVPDCGAALPPCRRVLAIEPRVVCAHIANTDTVGVCAGLSCIAGNVSQILVSLVELRPVNGIGTRGTQFAGRDIGNGRGGSGRIHRHATEVDGALRRLVVLDGACGG